MLPHEQHFILYHIHFICGIYSLNSQDYTRNALENPYAYVEMNLLNYMCDLDPFSRIQSHIFIQFILPAHLVLQTLTGFHPYPTPRVLSISVKLMSIIALISLDPNKAVGLDEIGPRVLRFCVAVLTKPFHHLFSIYIHLIIPQWGKIQKVILVFS